MIGAIFDEIRLFRDSGASEVDLAGIREAQVCRREVGLRENGYRRALLQGDWSYRQDPGLIPEYDDLVANATSERLRYAARRYLAESRCVPGVLLPESP
jgi:hypothetical protein